MIIINTEKGKKIFEDIKSDYNCTQIPYEDAFLGNHDRPVDITAERQIIFKELDNNTVSNVLSKYVTKVKKTNSKGIKGTIKKIVPKSIKKKIKKVIKK